MTTPREFFEEITAVTYDVDSIEDQRFKSLLILESDPSNDFNSTDQIAELEKKDTPEGGFTYLYKNIQIYPLLDDPDSLAKAKEFFKEIKAIKSRKEAKEGADEKKEEKTRPFDKDNDKLTFNPQPLSSDEEDLFRTLQTKMAEDVKSSSQIATLQQNIFSLYRRDYLDQLTYGSDSKNVMVFSAQKSRDTEMTGLTRISEADSIDRVVLMLELLLNRSHKYQREGLYRQVCTYVEAWLKEIPPPRKEDVDKVYNAIADTVEATSGAIGEKIVLPATAPTADKSVDRVFNISVKPLPTDEQEILLTSLTPAVEHYYKNIVAKELKDHPLTAIRTIAETLTHLCERGPQIRSSAKITLKVHEIKEIQELNDISKVKGSAINTSRKEALEKNFQMLKMRLMDEFKIPEGRLDFFMKSQFLDPLTSDELKVNARSQTLQFDREITYPYVFSTSPSATRRLLALQKSLEMKMDEKKAVEFLASVLFRNGSITFMNNIRTQLTSHLLQRAGGDTYADQLYLLAALNACMSFYIPRKVPLTKSGEEKKESDKSAIAVVDQFPENAVDVENLSGTPIPDPDHGKVVAAIAEGMYAGGPVKKFSSGVEAEDLISTFNKLNAKRDIGVVNFSGILAPPKEQQSDVYQGFWNLCKNKNVVVALGNCGMELNQNNEVKPRSDGEQSTGLEIIKFIAGFTNWVKENKLENQINELKLTLCENYLLTSDKLAERSVMVNRSHLLADKVVRVRADCVRNPVTGDFESGTSYAAPMVAGGLALANDENRDLFRRNLGRKIYTWQSLAEDALSPPATKETPKVVPSPISASPKEEMKETSFESAADEFTKVASVLTSGTSVAARPVLSQEDQEHLNRVTQEMETIVPLSLISTRV